MTLRTRQPAAKDLSDDDLSTLQNICRVAAERFSEHAALFRKQEQQPTPAEGSMIPTGQAAGRLAEQFERQAKEARQFADDFASAFPFTLILQPDEDEAEQRAS